MDPALLLAAAVDLYGSVPRAQLLTIVGAAFELGDGLSPVVVRQLPELFEQAHAIVESNRRSVAQLLRH